MLPENDRMIETCRSVLSVLMRILAAPSSRAV